MGDVPRGAPLWPGCVGSIQVPKALVSSELEPADCAIGILPPLLRLSMEPHDGSPLAASAGASAAGVSGAAVPSCLYPYWLCWAVWWLGLPLPFRPPLLFPLPLSRPLPLPLPVGGGVLGGWVPRAGLYPPGVVLGGVSVPVFCGGFAVVVVRVGVGHTGIWSAHLCPCGDPRPEAEGPTAASSGPTGVGLSVGVPYLASACSTPAGAASSRLRAMPWSDLWRSSTGLGLRLVCAAGRLSGPG